MFRPLLTFLFIVGTLAGCAEVRWAYEPVPYDTVAPYSYEARQTMASYGLCLGPYEFRHFWDSWNQYGLGSAGTCWGGYGRGYYNHGSVSSQDCLSPSTSQAIARTLCWVRLNCSAPEYFRLKSTR